MANDNLVLDDPFNAGPTVPRWRPIGEIPRHSGDPTEPDFDFFAAPPPEIGQILSAETTLRTKTKPWRLPTRLVLAALLAWAFYMLFDFIGSSAANGKDRDTYQIIGVCGGAVIAFVSWFLTRYSHSCSFVGNLGIAKVAATGSRDNVKPANIFLFENAAELRTSQTRHYHNGVYTGTNYTFTWTNSEGKKAHVLSGTYRGENKPPKPKDPFHFAVMAENAWSGFLFDRIVATLESTGSARFNLSGKHYVSVGQGFMDLCTSGTEEVHLDAKEIGGIQIDSGQVKIKRVDAKEGWFSSTGVYKFSYDQMANSKLFLLLYTRLIGQ